MLRFLFISTVSLTFLVAKSAFALSTVSVKFHAGSNKLTVGTDGVGTEIAQAKFDNKINQTGWSYLRVNTSEGFADHVQAYAAGVAEGHITRELTELQWINTLSTYCPKPYSSYCSKVEAFLSHNLHWMKEQIKQDKLSNDPLPYWHQVELFLYQAAGLADGLKGVEKSPNTDIDPMGIYLFQVGNDLEDLASVFGNLDPDLDLDVEHPLGSGSCSALVKLLPGNKELYVSQVTWDDYATMLRVLKVYHFPWHLVDGGKEKMAGSVQVFSSYPSSLMSGDDFYLLSSGMASMETTIGNKNNSLWKFVTPRSVLEGVRSVVANRLAKSGAEWVALFQQYNSGTYNNEWMIVDYKRFQPGMSALPAGVLTVLDQIPGMIRWADLTPLLTSQRYFPSYNVAYFPEIFNASGNWPMVEKYGPWFSYNQTARALIFRRDHSKVQDLQSMMRLMRYNDFKHDPLSRCNCTPPYSAENAISARNDLNAKDGTYPFGALGHRQHGSMDMKLTSWEMFGHLSFVAQGGPTWDDLPPFQWSTSDFRNSSHLGQPDLWKFSPVLFNGSAIFD